MCRHHGTHACDLVVRAHLWFLLRYAVCDVYLYGIDASWCKTQQCWPPFIVDSSSVTVRMCWRTTSFFSAEGEFEDVEEGLDDSELDSVYSEIECKLLDQARKLTDPWNGSWELYSSSGGLEVGCFFRCCLKPKLGLSLLSVCVCS